MKLSTVVYRDEYGFECWRFTTDDGHDESPHPVATPGFPTVADDGSHREEVEQETTTAGISLGPDVIGFGR